MTYVRARSGESVEDLLRRFKKAVENSKVLSDLKKHEYYEKPGVKRKRKGIAARKRLLEDKKKGKERRRNKTFKWNRDHTKKLPWKINFSGGRNTNSRKPFKRSGSNRDNLNRTNYQRNNSNRRSKTR